MTKRVIDKNPAMCDKNYRKRKSIVNEFNDRKEPVKAWTKRAEQSDIHCSTAMTLFRCSQTFEKFELEYVKVTHDP